MLIRWAFASRVTGNRGRNLWEAFPCAVYRSGGLAGLFSVFIEEAAGNLQSQFQCLGLLALTRLEIMPASGG
jgi:hypothetical protein